ncbi:MAG: hypothetical protein J5I53_10370 [Bradyrhizobiaceae bacterium]|nr:hypothetical protein [Bradyrhizobiaceae bacterium]
MVRTIAIWLLIAACWSAPCLHATCTDELLLAAKGTLVKYDIDTTGHWWAITQPFERYQQLVVDGEDYGTWDSVEVPVFAYDGSRWAARVVRSGEYAIVTETDTLRRTKPVSGVRFAAQGTQLWWIEHEGNVSTITDGDRTYTTTYPIESIHLDPMGVAVAWVERRPELSVLMRNGAEIARAQQLTLYGVWNDLQCLYSTSTANQTTLFVGETELASDIKRMFKVTVNPMATVVAWQSADAIGQVRTYLYTDTYAQPWEGPVVDSPDQQLALSPFDALVAYRTIRHGAKLVGYNSAMYPGGQQTSPPVFSHDGAVMVYCSKDNGDYVVVNGKRLVVKAGVPTTDLVAVNPSGTSVAWCSGTTLVTVDLEFSRMQMGMMCDTMGRAIYDWRTGTFKALGVMSGRLYLLTCTE